MNAQRHFIMTGQTKATVFFLVTVFALFWTAGMSSVQADQAHVNEMLKKAKYVGMDTCIQCHDKEGKEYKLSTHARIHIKDDTTGAEDCEICHGPGSVSLGCFRWDKQYY